LIHFPSARAPFHCIDDILSFCHNAAAAKIAKKAHKENLSLKESAMALGYCNEEQFHQWVRAEEMLAPSKPPTKK
jgi:aspartate ammonia-lyase